MSLERGAVVSIVGAGGKTSLMFQLAREMRSVWKVLVSTTTRILVPEEKCYDHLDLEGSLFLDQQPSAPGLYVGGRLDLLPGKPDKIKGVDSKIFDVAAKQFDLILLEADGASCKPLKGWNATEPVISSSTTHTIGVVDIQCLGKEVNGELVHRLELFSDLTGALPGQKLQLEHLASVVLSDDGLFRKSRGKKILYINKVESLPDMVNTARLKELCPELQVVFGSLRAGRCFV
jgi:probable selenium-dependent hydroxylase accessory protein YqeC